MNSYPGIGAGPETYTLDVDWAAGQMGSYKDGGGLISKALATQGNLPQGPVNGMYLANYDSTGYAAMDFCGGALLAGAGDLSAERALLEQWIADNS